MEETLNITLKVWRQDGPDERGRFETYDAPDVGVDMSFLEMLDIVNENLNDAGKEPITFESDCREGICGTCEPDDRRQGTWPRARARLPASSTCASTPMATPS